MGTSIYYFSATGNSLTTAKILSNELGGCNLVPVASARGLSKIKEDAESVGFVFPVYRGSIPYPVREAISKMVFRPDAYVFILATHRCGGKFGTVAQRADQLLKTRGQKLSLFHALPMPGNSNLSDPQTDMECLKTQRSRICELLDSINNKETKDYSEPNVLPQASVDFPNNDRGIMAEAHCIGCGTCINVCPMNNIVLRENKAFIGDECASCLACFHWCPVEAICISKRENISRRKKYHHPEVTLADIVSQKIPCRGAAEITTGDRPYII